jgi:hypothetical protein
MQYKKYSIALFATTSLLFSTFVNATIITGSFSGVVDASRDDLNYFGDGVGFGLQYGKTLRGEFKINTKNAPVAVKTPNRGLYYSDPGDWITFTWYLDNTNISHAPNVGRELVQIYNNFDIPNDTRPFPVDSYEVEDNSSVVINTSLTTRLVVSTFSKLEIQSLVGFVDSVEIEDQHDYLYNPSDPTFIRSLNWIMTNRYETYNPVTKKWEMTRFDDVSLHAALNVLNIIPEPSVLALMATGLAGLGFANRAKKKS